MRVEQQYGGQDAAAEPCSVQSASVRQRLRIDVVAIENLLLCVGDKKIQPQSRALLNRLVSSPEAECGLWPRLIVVLRGGQDAAAEPCSGESAGI